VLPGSQASSPASRQKSGSTNRDHNVTNSFGVVTLCVWVGRRRMAPDELADHCNRHLDSSQRKLCGPFQQRVATGFPPARR
jgi:hypothetical protein